MQLEDQIQQLISFSHTATNRLESLEQLVQHIQTKQMDFFNLRIDLEKWEKHRYRTLLVS